MQKTRNSLSQKAFEKGLILPVLPVLKNEQMQTDIEGIQEGCNQ